MMDLPCLTTALSALALAFAPIVQSAPEADAAQQEQQAQPAPFTPEELMIFSQCHGAVDGMAANVAAVIAKHPDTVPIEVLEMQEELTELADLLKTLSNRVSDDEQIRFPTYRQTEQALMRYNNAFAAHRDAPQSIPTIIAYVYDSVENLSDPCEDVLERLAKHYSPKGYPRTVE